MGKGELRTILRASAKWFVKTPADGVRRGNADELRPYSVLPPLLCASAPLREIVTELVPVA